MAINTDGGGNFVLSAANMAGGRDVSVTELFHSEYTITATDVAEMAAGARNSEICVMCIPKTTAPSLFVLQAWDTGHTFFDTTNLTFTWRQVGSDYYGLFIEDNGPVLGNGDTIDVIAIY